MNGEANCVLEICCPPDASKDALARELMAHCDIPQNHADRVAAHIKDHYDLAPNGSLKELYKQIARLAREGYVKA